MNLKEIKVLEVEPLQIENFNCRDEKVERYLKEEARIREEKNLTRTTVFIEADTGEVIGYYSMHAASTQLARYIRKNVEWDDIIHSEKETHYATIKLHFFGRSNNDVYKGIGTQFLMHFLHFLFKCYELAQVIGVALITLECKTDLKPYYEENGFKCIGSVGERKIMAMKSTELKELFA